jgi:hypothetical protein
LSITVKSVPKRVAAKIYQRVDQSRAPGSVTRPIATDPYRPVVGATTPPDGIPPVAKAKTKRDDKSPTVG